jgi:putative DNA primase/helicase
MTAVQPLGTPIDRVLAKVKHKGAGTGKWMAVCPGHDDRNASLSIKVGQDGKVLLNCHAGCKASDIAASIGLTMADLFPEETKRKPIASTVDPRNRPSMVKSYDYTDANGTLVHQTCRMNPKSFRQRRPDGNGGWVWSLEGIEPVLYNLPAVIEGIALGKTIHIVEGEKDADALKEAGLIATTCPMGAGKWRESYTKVFSNAAVAILPDNDEPGHKHAEHVAKELAARGCVVKIVKLPGLPPKGDVSDWFDRPDSDVADLEAIINRVPVWGPRKVKWKLSELWKSESIMRPPSAVVPRLAWEGRSTLLAAREKAGKSTLIGYITARVSKGEEFLGEYCVRGDVLIVGLEEFLGDVARRLKRFGADGEKVTLVDGFLGQSTRAAEIAAHIDDITPALVVVDSLVAFANDRGIDENDAAMATIVQPLTDMAHSTGTALIIVHHANKSAGKARGSTAITGATDVVCEFLTPDEDGDPTNRRVRSVGRVPLIRQYDMRFDGDTYELADGPKVPIEQRIIATLRDRPAISTNDVADAVGGSKTDVISTLHRMQAENVVANQTDSFRRAKWILPNPKLI